MAEVKIINLDEVLRNLKRAGRKGREALVEAIHEEIYDIEAEAVQQVPVDTGLLRSSREVTVERQAHGVYAAIEWSTEKFGGRRGVGTEYAVYVHEGGRGGNANFVTGKKHFLSDPFEAAAQGMERRIANRIRSRLNL